MSLGLETDAVHAKLFVEEQNAVELKKKKELQRGGKKKLMCWKPTANSKVVF